MYKNLQSLSVLPFPKAPLDRQPGNFALERLPGVRKPAKQKKSLKDWRPFFERITAAAIVLLFSLILGPYYTGGDQGVYRRVYEALSYLDIGEGFLFYSKNLTSQEYIHFVLSWLASRFIEKDLFIAFSNALLAYVAMSLLQKWKVLTAIAFVVILTNFYILVLYFAAERLKFGFIFLTLSVTYIDQKPRLLVLTALAVFSHVQLFIIYFSMLLNFLRDQILKTLRLRKLSSLALWIWLLAIPAWFMGDHIEKKFGIYYSEKELMEIARSTLFMVMSIFYSKKKSHVVFVFVPVILSAFLVGGDRVNLFGYFLFLYYSLHFRRGWNVGVLITSVYFAVSSIKFVLNVVQYGDGFADQSEMF